MLKKTILAGLGLLAGSGLAAADTYTSEMSDEHPGMYSYAWSEPGLTSQIGVGLQFGGGIAGFTDRALRDTVDTNVSGMWTARASIGTHIPIGLEVSYVGTAVDILPIGASAKGTLLGTDVDAALRYNILPHYAWNPYAFAGAGWQRYNVRNANFSTADTGMKNKDDLVVYPVGAGISYRDPSGFVFDVRGTFRAAGSSTLLVDPSGNKADLHTWDASGQLGYEF